MTTVIFRSRLHWEGATRAVLKSSSENHVSEEHFSSWQGRAMTHWQGPSNRQRPIAAGYDFPLPGKAGPSRPRCPNPGRQGDTQLVGRLDG
jgi:hypothetical protein